MHLWIHKIFKRSSDKPGSSLSYHEASLVFGRMKWARHSDLPIDHTTRCLGNRRYRVLKQGSHHCADSNMKPQWVMSNSKQDMLSEPLYTECLVGLSICIELLLEFSFSNNLNCIAFLVLQINLA